MNFARTAGWEGRLAAIIEGARHQPYQLGVHDCFKVACMAVQALSGVWLWPEFAGSYRTRAQALRRIAEYGGEFDAAFSKLFRTDHSPVTMARRGDIVKVLRAGVPHLGVCNGATIALLTDSGLAFAPITEGACCWRIG